MKKLNLLFIALSTFVLIACGGGGGGDDAPVNQDETVTPIDRNDYSTFDGTYRTLEMQIFTDGKQDYTSADSDVFTAYFAVDSQNDRCLEDIYSEESGIVEQDMSRIIPGNFEDNYNTEGISYETDGLYLTVRISDPELGAEIFHINYQYEKISDDIIEEHFRVLSE